MLEEYIPWIGKKGSAVKSFFQHVYALLVVCIGFVFFRAETMAQGCFWVRKMFTGFGWNAGAMSFALQQMTPVFLVTLAGALIACCIKEAKEIAFHDLGCESVKRFTIENLPIFTAIDCQGTSIFAEGRKEFALL